MASTYTVYGHLPSGLLKFHASFMRTGLTKTEADKIAKEQRAAGGLAEVVPDDQLCVAEEDEEDYEEDEGDEDEDEDEDEDDEDEDDDEGDDEISVSGKPSKANARKQKSPAELDRDIAKVIGNEYPLLRGPGLWHERAGQTRKQIAKERDPVSRHATMNRPAKSYRVSARVGGGTTNPENLATVGKKSEAMKIARDFMKKTPPKSQYDSVQILPLVRGERDWNTESIRWHGVTTNVPRPTWVRGQGIK